MIIEMKPKKEAAAQASFWLPQAAQAADAVRKKKLHSPQ
jgi:hypothetical protein